MGNAWPLVTCSGSLSPPLVKTPGQEGNIGYARVSTDDQDLRLQRAALKAAGCRRIFDEKVSGAKRDRPELARLLDQMRDDDVMVVTRLDRLARST